MKKHLSVFGLMVRTTLYRTLLICTLAFVAQLGLCIFFLQKGTVKGEAFYSLEQLLSFRFFEWIAAAAFLGICALLCLCGCELSSSRSGYTLRRLQIGERCTVLWAAVSNAGMLFLLWASQLAVVLIANLIYRQFFLTTVPDTQSLLIAFYRSDYLHSLLPLRETSLLLRNLLLLVSLSFCCAAFSYHQRRGHYRLEPLILVLFTLFYFPQQVGSLEQDAVLILVALAGIVFSLFSLRGGAADEAAS